MLFVFTGKVLLILTFGRQCPVVIQFSGKEKSKEKTVNILLSKDTIYNFKILINLTVKRETNMMVVLPNNS